VVAMYEKTGTINKKTHDRLKSIAKAATWKVVKGSGRDYETSFCDVKDLFEWDNVQSFFFLKIPPGGKVHRHIDTCRPWSTYHVVVQTNPKAISYFCDDDGEYQFKGALKGIYKIDRQVEHWSVNDGKSDRIHLLCEVYD